MRPTKTTKQIEDVLGRCAEADDEGTHYHGLSYEEGVKDALTWAFSTGLDEPDEWPFEEEVEI